MKNKLTILMGLLAVSLLAACGAAMNNQSQPSAQVFPTATYHFLLQGSAEVGTPYSPIALSGAPTVASIFRQQPTVTPSASSVPTSTLNPTSIATQTLEPQLVTVPIYDDHLNPNWVVQKNTGTNFDLNSAVQVHSGKSAISFVPRVKNSTQYGTLLFTVSDQSKEAYPRDQVSALTFWLYSGDETLLLDQVAVTILGSNSQPFWKAKDDSVTASSGQSPVFSETRLYFLGFNRDIPAKTWVQVEVDLDKLIYDPDYKYVTGFYLKMEKGFSRTLWVDDINLMMLSKPSAFSTPDITATP